MAPNSIAGPSDSRQGPSTRTAKPTIGTTTSACGPAGDRRGMPFASRRHLLRGTHEATTFHATGFALHHRQSGEGSRDAELRGIASVNAGHERIGEDISGLLAVHVGATKSATSSSSGSGTSARALFRAHGSVRRCHLPRSVRATRRAARRTEAARKACDARSPRNR